MTIVEDLSIPAADGYALAATRYRPAVPRSRVVIASATAVPRGYYARFATALAEAGLDVLSFDYRGIGGSRPPRLRGFSALMSDWGRLDLEGVLRAHADGPGELGVVAHSVGAQILPLAPSAVRVARIFSVGGQSGDYRNWDGLGRFAMASLWFGVLPAVATVFGHVPGWMGMGADLPAGVARQWASWGRTAGYLLADPAHRAAFARITARVHALAIRDDRYAPERAVRALFEGYRAARVDVEVVDPATVGLRRLGHFGYFRAAAAPLWPRAIAFLTD